MSALEENQLAPDDEMLTEGVLYFDGGSDILNGPTSSMLG
jgi:hypothetical protein